MPKTTSIVIILLLVACASDGLRAQMNNAASQAVTFGVVRKSAVVERALSSMRLSGVWVSAPGPVHSVRGPEDVPIKITVSLNVTQPGESFRRAMESRPATAKTGSSLVPVSVAEAQKQIDLQVLIAEHRTLRVNNAPLIVTITD